MNTSSSRHVPTLLTLAALTTAPMPSNAQPTQEEMIEMAVLERETCDNSSEQSQAKSAIELKIEQRRQRLENAQFTLPEEGVRIFQTIMENECGFMPLNGIAEIGDGVKYLVNDLYRWNKAKHKEDDPPWASAQRMFMALTREDGWPDNCPDIKQDFLNKCEAIQKEIRHMIETGVCESIEFSGYRPDDENKTSSNCGKNSYTDRYKTQQIQELLEREMPNIMRANFFRCNGVSNPTNNQKYRRKQRTGNRKH